MAFNKTLVAKKGRLNERCDLNLCSCNTFAPPELKPIKNTNRMKKYLSERNALTVVVSVFCFIMMILAIANNGSLWEALAFALAFSFSVELICHRAKEN